MSTASVRAILFWVFCAHSVLADQQPALKLKIFVQQPQPPSVLQLVKGRLENIHDGSILVSSSTLIQDGGYHIVVDTPAATDIQSKEKMLAGLVSRNLIPGQVQMVVTTHGHPDHFGQLNFFPNARHFFGSYEYSNVDFLKTELNQAEAMRLTQNVELWNTPGHTAQDLSVIVRNVPCCGTVAVVGDLIYSEHDVFNYTEWYYDAWNPKIGLNNRNKVICCVDWIVPGHGKMFKVTQEMRYRANCTGGFVPTTTLPPPSTAQPTWTWTWDPTSTAPTTTTVDPTTPSITPSTTTTSTTTTATTTTTTPAPTTPAPTTTTLEPTTASKYITVDYHWNNRINDVPTESTTLPTPPPTTTTPAPPAPVRVVAPVPPPLSYVAAPPTHLGYFAPCALTTIHPCPAAFLAPSANSNQLLYPVLQQLVDYAEPGSRAVPTHASGYFNLIGKAFKKFAGDHRITAEISPKMAK